MWSTLLVTKSAGAFLRPSEPTPSGNLPLALADTYILRGTFIEMMFVFTQGGGDAIEVVKRALGKALVPYYPLAGRLVRSERGETEVTCTGDGVWFVEGAANCRLKDVEGLLDQQPLGLKDQLITYPPDPVGLPIFIQVTQFTCGGFVTGFVYDHIIADGAGMAQFMVSVGEMARGAESPSVEPIWCREAGRAIGQKPASTESRPPHSSPPPPPPIPPRNHYFHIDISSCHIDKLKDQLLQQTGHVWSTFEIIAAKTWQSRAKAINLEPNTDVGMAFLANIRHLVLDKALPAGGKGYYGNCIFPMVITMPIGKLITTSTVEVMNLIKVAKERLPIQVSECSKGGGPPMLPLGYGLMFLTAWTRLGFEEVDYGWGKPDYVAPMMETVPGVVSYLMRSPTPKKGMRLITKCVVEEHLAAFQYEMVNAFGN